MSYIFDKLKRLDKSLNQDRFMTQQILNARLSGLSIVFIDDDEYASLETKDPNTLYLVDVDDNTINMYKGSVRIQFSGKEYNHAIVVQEF